MKSFTIIETIQKIFITYHSFLKGDFLEKRSYSIAQSINAATCHVIRTTT